MGIEPAPGNKKAIDKIDLYFESEARRYKSVLERVGEVFTNESRLINTYKDQTGNLRSSIGYTIGKDGKVDKKAARRIVRKGHEGASTGEQFGSELISGEPPQSLTLVGYAGMHYAKYVEAKNLDVITGPAKRALRKIEFLFKNHQKK